ncbi:hypothetical protein J6590_096686, partial [Homalodisca vitripennis]
LLSGGLGVGTDRVGPRCSERRLRRRCTVQGSSRKAGWRGMRRTGRGGGSRRGRETRDR